MGRKVAKESLPDTEHLASSGALWDFGRIKGHKRETTERPFPPVRDWQAIVSAGQLSDGSLLGHLIRRAFDSTLSVTSPRRCRVACSLDAA